MPILSRCLRLIDRKREPAILWHEHAGAVHANSSGAAALGDRHSARALHHSAGVARNGMCAAEARTPLGPFSVLPVPYVRGGGVFMLALGGTLESWPELVRRAFESDAPASQWFEVLEGDDVDEIGFGRPASVELPSAAILRATLPQPSPRFAGVALDVAYRVAGTSALAACDWYDAFEAPGGTLGLAIGDVSANDLGGARGMHDVRACIRDAARSGDSAHQVLSAANRAAASNGASRVSGFFGILDPLTRELTHASAAGPEPLVIENDCSVRALENGGVPLGTGAARTYVLESTSLAGARAVALFTGGLLTGSNADCAGMKRVREIIAAWARDGARATASQLVDSILGTRPQPEDAALLTVRFAPSTELVFEIEATVHAARRARYGVTRFLSQFELSEERRFGFVTALSEAINNAVEHGSRTQKDAVCVDLTFGAGSVRATIASTGSWLPHVARIERGRGLTLMRALSTSLDIDSSVEGTRVHLELDGARLAGNARANDCRSET